MLSPPEYSFASLVFCSGDIIARASKMLCTSANSTIKSMPSFVIKMPIEKNKSVIKKERSSLALLLILMILGVGCASHRAIIRPRYVMESRPVPRPTLIDHSPKPCPECLPINKQKMWKLTERDFVKIKVKLTELDDYIQYLLDLQ